MAIQIQDIEIFSEVEENRRNQVEALFINETYAKGDLITSYGDPVDGLYLMDEGEVEVTIPGYEGVLATLQAGMSFGEMSLLKPNEVASATVTVTSETAELMFCPRDALNLALQIDETLAVGFYRGSTLLMSGRLKQMNQKISGEIAASMKMASGLVDDISSTGDLGMMREDLESAGTVIVSGMTDIVKKLMVLKAANEAIAPDDISDLADQAKEIYYSDFQVFERVNNQLKALGQHLDNVNRILTQQEMLEVEEDMSLHDFS